MTSAEAPYPPLHLAHRVLALDGWDDPFLAYEQFGLETRHTIESMLPEDWSWHGKRVLDFGCGAGRTLRHFLPEAQRAEFLGVDIDQASIDWLRSSLSPPLTVQQCGVVPPLDIPSESLHLAWAISVFTHLTDASPAWLLELHRVLQPDGLLIATYMGRWNSEILADEPWDENRVGMNVLRDGHGWEHGGPMVLMSDWWVRTHWGRAFEILATKPRIHNQTWVLLRKRDVQLTVADIQRPEPDVREYLAFRHNIRQVRRELEAEYQAKLAEYERSIEGYEYSRSWRLTRPLRAITRLARAGRSLPAVGRWRR